MDEYCALHSDDFPSSLTYVDDGYSGTGTNRDGFQQLLADVMSKKVNCVIVKDLSRSVKFKFADELRRIADYVPNTVVSSDN